MWKKKSKVKKIEVKKLNLKKIKAKKKPKEKKPKEKNPKQKKPKEKKPKQKNRNKKITLRIECKRDELLQIMSENVQIGVFLHLELINWLIHEDKRCNHRNW